MRATVLGYSYDVPWPGHPGGRATDHVRFTTANGTTVAATGGHPAGGQASCWHRQFPQPLRA